MYKGWRRGSSRTAKKPDKNHQTRAKAVSSSQTVFAIGLVHMVFLWAVSRVPTIGSGKEACVMNRSIPTPGGEWPRGSTAGPKTEARHGAVRFAVGEYSAVK